jgi:hypothetical protein
MLTNICGLLIYLLLPTDEEKVEEGCPQSNFKEGQQEGSQGGS